MKNLLKSALLLTVLGLSAWAQDAGISNVGWSADGRYLVTVNPSSRRLRVHDGSTGLLLKAVTAPGEKTAYISFSPDSGREEPNSLGALAVSGDCALTAGKDQILQWWRLPALDLVASAQGSYAVRGVSLGGEGQIGAYTCTSSRDLDSEMNALWLTNGAIQSRLFSELPPPDSSESFGVPQFSPDGAWAVAKASDTLQVWRMEPAGTTKISSASLDVAGMALGNTHFFTVDPQGVAMRSYQAPDIEIRRFVCPGAVEAAVDGDETRLVVRGPKVLVWDLSGQAQPQQWAVSADALWAAPDLSKLALRRAGLLEVWDVPSGKKVYALPLKGALPQQRTP